MLKTVKKMNKTSEDIIFRKKKAGDRLPNSIPEGETVPLKIKRTTPSTLTTKQESKKVDWKIAETDKYVFAEFTIQGGVISPSDIEKIQLPIPPHKAAGKGIILSGRGPVWLYAKLVHDAHPFSWVATYDPRLKGAVVVATHNPDVKVGEVIPVNYDSLIFSSNVKSPFIIAVCGDPNSGKSVFLRLLYDTFSKKGIPVISQEGDIWAPTQGWSLSEEGVKIRKKVLKPQLKKATQQRLQWILHSLEGLKNFRGIVLVDIGGGRPNEGIRVTPENKTILEKCTHVIICSRDDAGQIEAWKRELKEKVPHIKILKCLKSVYSPDGKYNFKEEEAIWHLDRTAYANSLIPIQTLKKIEKIVEEVINSS